MEKVINSFSGEYEFLSNFYITPVVFEGIQYNCSECAFQSAKTLSIPLRETFKDKLPGQAKRDGRKLKLRYDWDRVKDSIMLEVVRDKFNRTPALREMLLATGDATLIEGNYWGDEYWGVCNGVGQNKLGKILMTVRSELKHEYSINREGKD